MPQYRHLHDLQCPSRYIPGEQDDVEGVADEDVEAACRCSGDGRFLNPRARPVREPDAEVTTA